MEPHSSMKDQKGRYLYDLEKCVAEMTCSHFVGMPSKAALYGTAPISKRRNNGKASHESSHNSYCSERLLEVQELFKEFPISHFTGMPSKEQLMGPVQPTGSLTKAKGTQSSTARRRSPSGNLEGKATTSAPHKTIMQSGAQK